MPRGTKPGATRRPYRKHTRRRKTSPALADALRQASTLAEALALPQRAAVGLSESSVRMIRAGRRKAPLAPS